MVYPIPAKNHMVILECSSPLNISYVLKWMHFTKLQGHHFTEDFIRPTYRTTYNAYYYIAEPNNKGTVSHIMMVATRTPT